MEHQLKDNKLTLLFGRICSGKSSYRKNETVVRITVSDIVKSAISEYAATITREQLQDTMHLDSIIAERIITCIDIYDAAYGIDIIVDGIRQVSIVKKVLDEYPNAELVWLDVPTEERKRRYESRKDARDMEPFEIADGKPIELECQKIFDTFQSNLIIINNYGINQEG